jgi:hypothetical protein
MGKTVARVEVESAFAAAPQIVGAGPASVIIGTVPDAAPTLAKLEAEISTAPTEHHDEVVHRIAIALVEIAVAEHAARNGNGHVSTPKLCTICRARIAANHRTVCHSCRGRERRERERLRAAHINELQAAANGGRGDRARELVLGERVSGPSG